MMTMATTESTGQPTPLAAGLDVARHQESALLADLISGDADAFERMVRTYGGRLLAVARRLLRNDGDAEDAVQEGFLAAFRALPTFRGECRLSTWLHRIVVNAALMRMRTRRRHPEASIEDLLPAFLPDGQHAASPIGWGDAEQALTAKETRVRVRAAIDRLPESYRTVLILRDIEELDTRATAQMLGVTTTAVKVRLHRARLALATLLAPAA